MIKKYTAHLIYALFALLATALILALSLNLAYADEKGAQVSIGASGQAVVRDAEVLSVSGSSIIVQTSWGATSITWTVYTTGSTKFFPDGDSRTVLHAIKVGDRVGFSGMLDLTAAHPSIRATVVRDSSLENDTAVLSGTVSSLGLHSLTLLTDTGTTSVSVASGTVITRDGSPIALSNLNAGDTVKVLGSLNLITHTLSASKITYASALNPTDTKVVVGTGFFTRLINWLRGDSGGAITIK